MTKLKLSDKDQAMLDGKHGKAAQMAMEILTRMGTIWGAEEMIDISCAHIDGCLYHGDSGIDFAEALVDGEGLVSVATTLNVGSVDQLHPEMFSGSEELRKQGQRLMDAYLALGCKAVWTCAPYQLMLRPGVGEQIAWAESNAIVFANSVLGARTNRYGDFIDICAAITGRVPYCGLHITHNRAAEWVIDVTHLSPSLLADDSFFPVLGYWLGKTVGSIVPVIHGLLPETTEDQLKALGAASASSGAVALFHAVGLTPEAPNLEAALQAKEAKKTIAPSLEDLLSVRKELSTAPDGPIAVVALGSPHYSVSECEKLFDALSENYQVAENVEFVLCTNRATLEVINKNGWAQRFKEVGIQIVVDTCVVVTPIVRQREGTLMTNSGKFAHYAPGNIGLHSIFGSLKECVDSAAKGHVVRDTNTWGGIYE